MTREKTAKFVIECELGPANRFRFVATLVGSTSQVLATGAGGQDVELFKALLRKLAAVYPVSDVMEVDVEGHRIVGVP